MNMPSAMAANPTQVPGRVGWSSVADRLALAERLFLGADSHPQEREVEGEEDDAVPHQAKGQRQDEDLARNDAVVGMRQPAIGPAVDQSLAGKHDDARGPAGPQGHEHPGAQSLKGEEYRDQDRVRRGQRLRDDEVPQPEQPGGVQSDQQRVVARRHFDRAPAEKPGRIASGDDQFAEALQRDECQNGKRQRHAARARDSTPQVKPGPSAVMTVRLGRPSAISRSSTNRTVGADMLPYRDSTARS